ncbi:type VII secretion integral membrane protein EccD [Cellulomonas denverensis]|uniref:Type VII secretion integral membrane protein EccD n=1 Tax=Cellulomonas denverensis TaxID=264297 RepID=A0A7X6KSB5_9CELL|nr:type VII secretion integral membrane protein EccD [Cellulomonas denverensis]NKY21376.1 type VII secretion integral membrane protein EccD [Cellulomonas denverensis]
MNQTASATRTLVHLTVSSDDRRVDVSVPAQVPLVEVLPAIARDLGALGPSLVHGGFALRRADGSDLDPSGTCLGQGLRDGELLTLARGTQLTDQRRYDDIVEAVIDATQDGRAPWTATDRARTALAASLMLLAIGAVLLWWAPPSGVLAPMIALGAALVLVVTGSVLTRVGSPEAGNGLGLAAAVYGAVGSWSLVPDPDPWGWSPAAACLGLAVVGGLALAGTATSPQVHLIPIVTGLALGTVAAVVALTGADLVMPYALLVAGLAATSNVLPWLALSSTRIAVISPQSDADVLADPPPVDGPEVARRAEQGHAVLLGLRIAFALCVLAATPIVATSGVVGALLCTAAFTGMMFAGRQVYARVEVAVLTGLGTCGLAVTGVVVALAGTVDPSALLIVLLATAALVVTLTWVSTTTSITLTRWLDAAELVCLVAILPLGTLAAGLG